MKRKSFRFTLLASVMLVATVLMGCTSIDDNPVVPTTVHQDGDDSDGPAEYLRPVAADGLAAFMENIIRRDSLGDFASYGYGRPLDEADPSVLSVGVESLEDADGIFRSFIADTTNYVSIGTGNITYMPHDSLGNKQGEIYLTAGGDGCIARITFSDDTPIDRDLVSEIRFIDKKLWPDNDAPRFIVGHIYAYAEDWTNWNNRGDNVQGLFVDITDADVKDQGSDDHYRSHEVGVKFLCVRDESYGNSAMLFWASRKKYAYEWDRVYSYNSQKWAGVWFNDNTDTYSGKFYKNEVRINQIQGEWIIPREPDRSHNCTIEELKTISECLNKDWDKFVKVYGSNRLDDTWYWSSEQAWGPATFRLWTYNLKKGKQDYYRAYTNYWHLSGVTRPYTDCRIIYQSEAEKIKWIFYGDENYLYKQRGGWYKP